MFSFAKVLGVRMALLIVVAGCIYVVISSQDFDTRAVFATVAIVTEIIRDAYTLHEMVPIPTRARKRK